MYSYGALLGFAFFVGWYLSLHLAERDGLPRRVAGLWYVATAISALVGSKVLFVLTNLDAMRRPADFVSGTGLVAYGGFVGGFLGAALYGRVIRRPLGVWGDAAAPSICLGLAIVRVGCLLAGCDFGTESEGPLALHFPPGSPAYLQQRAAGLLPAGAATSLGVHPTQVYESIAGMLLLAFTLYVRARRPGQGFIAFILGYAAFRFALEFMRGDFGRGIYGPFSTSQWIALATSLVALVVLVRSAPPAPRAARRSGG